MLDICDVQRGLCTQWYQKGALTPLSPPTSVTILPLPSGSLSTPILRPLVRTLKCI